MRSAGSTVLFGVWLAWAAPGAVRADDVTLQALPDVSFQESAALAGQGFRTSTDIRRKAVPLNAKERDALAKTLAMTRERLDELLGRAEIMGWKGVTPDLAVHMGRCGGGSYEALASIDTVALRTCLWRRITGTESDPPNAEDTADGKVPTAAQLDAWAQEARRAGFAVVQSTQERALPMDQVPGLSVAAREAARKEKWATNLDAASDLATGAQRVKVQKKRKLSTDDLNTLYGMVDLLRMGELEPQLALLLMRSGVSSLQHLAGANVTDLEHRIRVTNEAEHLVSQPPAADQLRALIDRAKEFPKGR